MEGERAHGGPRRWHVAGLHHVAFARGQDPTVDDALCALLDLTPEEERGPGFVERMYPAGDAWLQTLEADGEGVVQRFLDARGPALHHLALSVDRLDEALDDLSRQGLRLVDRHPRPGGMGTRVAFLHPSTFGGLLVELVEVPAEGAP